MSSCHLRAVASPSFVTEDKLVLQHLETTPKLLETLNVTLSSLLLSSSPPSSLKHTDIIPHIKAFYWTVAAGRGHKASLSDLLLNQSDSTLPFFISHPLSLSEVLKTQIKGWNQAVSLSAHRIDKRRRDCLVSFCSSNPRVFQKGTRDAASEASARIKVSARVQSGLTSIPPCFTAVTSIKPRRRRESRVGLSACRVLQVLARAPKATSQRPLMF